MMKIHAIILLSLVTIFSSLESAEATNIRMECDRFELILTTDGRTQALFSKSASNKVKENGSADKIHIFSADLIQNEIAVPYNVNDRTGTRTIDLKSTWLEGDKLIVSAERDQLPRFTFLVSGKNNDYVTFRLIKVEDVVGNERVANLRIKIPYDVEVFPLDCMTMKSGNSEISWPGIWCRNSHNPLGGFALWYPDNDEDDDNTFYQIWANEDLPHPKIDGKWTVERAKEWVSKWQEKFSSYRMMYILPDKPEDLRPLADEAATWGMTHVYLHKDVWFKDGYWENYSDSSELNRKIFPNGKEDLLEYSKYLNSKGKGLTLRTTSWGIGKNNSNYVGKEASRDFAKWITGKLVKPVDSKSDEILFRPDEGMLYPASFVPGSIRINQILIDNEIISFSSLVDTEKPVWRFLGCERGSYVTKAVKHDAGSNVSGLKMCHGQVFCPDPDKELFEEQAKGYAEFMNSLLIDNCNFDALEVYNVNPYGRHKFLDAVYRKIDHPTWSFTSGGFPQWGWFELQFESTKKRLGFDRLSSIPKRQDMMIGLHQESWPASGPYDYCYAIVPNAIAGWCYLRLQANKGFHNINLEEMEKLGLKNHYIENLNIWNKLGPTLSESQKHRIYSAYFNRETLFGREGAYPSADELFRIEDVDGSKAVIPFRMMKRKDGDRPWSYAQEHGLVKPAQYVRPGAAAFEVDNPYAPQIPEFTIRVMKDLARNVYERENIATGESKETREFNDMLDTFLGASGVTIDSQSKAKALDKVDLRILPKAEEIENVGRTRFSNEEKGLSVTFQNEGSSPYTLIGFKKDDLPWYRVNTDISSARGLGIVVNGDGSGAILTVRTSGNGTRDFAVKINFKGRRYIEIPTPEACWANGDLTWTTAYKRYRSNHVTKISLGFAAVPPRTRASVLLEDVRFLPEIDSAIRNPIIHVGDGELKIDGVIPTGHYLWYKGGDKVGVYDLNWNLKEELPVKLKNFKAASGYNPIRITHDKGNSNPWLESLFFVHDKPMFIKQN